MLCPVRRTHQGKCHALLRCPEYIGGVPYYQPPNCGLSCKWVTGPGGFVYNRCDNYQSYHDVSVNGEILNDPGFPKVSFEQTQLPTPTKSWDYTPVILGLCVMIVIGIVYLNKI